jgi:hypothetical protein
MKNLLLYSQTANAWRPHSQRFHSNEDVNRFLKSKPGENITLVKGHVNFDGSFRGKTEQEVNRILSSGRSAAIIVPSEVDALPPLVREVQA